MQAAPLKIACIGNSITYGALIDNRERNSYPAQLQEYLDHDGYEVRNFGVSATTLLHGGDFPYITTPEYQASLQYRPDIVLIKLGTNDSKPENRDLLESDYVKDYTALIESYRALPSRPRIILLTPAKCYTDVHISDSVIRDRVIPLLEQVAFDNDAELLDLYHLFGDHYDPALMPDRVHPSSVGAARIAHRIGEYIVVTADRQPFEPELPGLAGPVNFHGYQQRELTIRADDQQVQCLLASPRLAAPGRPWVLRARFWDHQPQVDIALLEAGFHIAYCDVADLYGSPRAVKRWNRFYQVMQAGGFAPKVVLEGMSRGGLILYNWAAQYPDRVAAIYADAPVLDLGSWPMGPGGNEEDTRKMLAAYGFKNREEALSWRGNPVDHAPLLAGTDIPILHVVGDLDVGVPVAQNTRLFEERYLSGGGTRMQVIHKPDTGHHPHSLHDPSPIVDFLLGATGYPRRNPCVVPVPSSEFTPAAEWREDAEWYGVEQEIRDALAARVAEGGRLKLLLIGNSITQGFGGRRPSVTVKPGLAAMNALLGESGWETAGISRDRTQHIGWRIRNGNYNIARPEYVVITAGVNNLLSGNAPAQVAEGVEMLAREAVAAFPDSRIILLGPLPAGLLPQSNLQDRCNEVHRLLAATDWSDGAYAGRVSYVDPTAWFLRADGRLQEELYVADHLHLDEKGYEVWSAKIASLIR